jgi:hypothetical protein
LLLYGTKLRKDRGFVSLTYDGTPYHLTGRAAVLFLQHQETFKLLSIYALERSMQLFIDDYFICREKNSLHKKGQLISEEYFLVFSYSKKHSEIN